MIGLKVLLPSYLLTDAIHPRSHAPAWECMWRRSSVAGCKASLIKYPRIYRYSQIATLERRYMHSHAGAWERGCVISFIMKFLVAIFIIVVCNCSYATDNETIEKIDIEIARYYINTRFRSQDFPSYIKTSQQLNRFLIKYYPNEKHELRQIILHKNKINKDILIGWYYAPVWWHFWSVKDIYVWREQQWQQFQNKIEQITKTAKLKNTITSINQYITLLILVIFSLIIIIISYKNKYSDVKKMPEDQCLVIGESVIGKSHIDTGMPCQDSNFYQKIDENGWGIAIVADGAGSAKNSHDGSKFVVHKAAQVFAEAMDKTDWYPKNQLPSESEWHQFSKEQLWKVRQLLEKYANWRNVEIKSLACTVIIVIYSPVGILITHIGDGRAAYCDSKHVWKSMMTPYKGEEANATVFITSDIWNNNINRFIESRIINEKIIAFALMSDGCEKACFECSKFNPATNKWSDPNNPYPKFFQPVLNTLINMEKNQIPANEIQAKWKKFLEVGNTTLKNEPDDKTMILGIYHGSIL
jgi:hypothetical protein